MYKIFTYKHVPLMLFKSEKIVGRLCSSRRFTFQLCVCVRMTASSVGVNNTM